MLTLFPLFRNLLILGACCLSSGAYAVSEQLASRIVDNHAARIFDNCKAAGMALVVIDNNQVVTRTFGETRPGNGIRPRQNSLIRIASLTKPMAGEVMVKLANEGKLKLDDPLSKYAPKGVIVPAYSAQFPIRLIHLITHTSGIPREQPGRPEKTPVFTWPTKSARWQWLKKAAIKVPPGVQASYSNLAYDLLADALATAGGKPYPVLFREMVTQPRGMKDTTFKPTQEQCSRLMVGYGASSCRETTSAIGSGGVYSTPADMQRWMQGFLSSQFGKRKYTAVQEQKMYFKRSQLSALKGMDVAGQADGIGLGWIYMEPREGLPAIIQKTGGGGGFMTYMAMIPERNIGVFVVATRTAHSKFKPMSNGVNELVAALSDNQGIDSEWFQVGKIK